MPTYASIRGHRLRVVGSPQRWQVMSPAVEDRASKELLFDIAITDDGHAQFLLVYESQDGEYSADDWYETLDEAFASAEERFGLRRHEWVTA